MASQPIGLGWEDANEAYAEVDEHIGSQEVEVEEVLDASIDDMHTRSNICHYFVNVDEDDSNTRKTTHVDHDLEDCREVTCPIPESIERSNNAKIFTLPLIPAPTIRRQSTSTHVIDYSKYWIVINDEYLAELKQMAE